MMPRTEDNSSEQSYEYSYPLNSIEGNGNVLLGADLRKEVLDYFENMYGFEAEYCTSEYVGLCPFELYRLKPSCASE